jgi:uncharacterized protein YlxP (DUF503 family)
VFTGSLTADLLLGDVHSLKGKRSVVRPLVAELRRRFAVAAAEVGDADLSRGRNTPPPPLARLPPPPRWRGTPVR